MVCVRRRQTITAVCTFDHHLYVYMYIRIVFRPSPLPIQLNRPGSILTATLPRESALEALQQTLNTCAGFHLTLSWFMVATHSYLGCVFIHVCSSSKECSVLT